MYNVPFKTKLNWRERERDFKEFTILGIETTLMSLVLTIHVFHKLITSEPGYERINIDT